MTASTPARALELASQAVAAKKLSPSALENLKRWLTEPQYAKFVPAILKDVDAADFAKLDQMFWEIIPFGTGGRRGVMGDYGSASMNPRTVAESADGLAKYLKQATGKEGGSGVIAHDSRNRSVEFAKLTATTLAANGLTVYYFEGCRSTPELSFAVRHLKCDVGVVVSASHNPPADNGFKAYWSNGAQVLPPHDKGIIDWVYKAGEIPTLDFDAGVQSGKIKVIGADVDKAYIQSVASLSLSDARDVKAVFTPLHGVGETSVYQVIHTAGFQQVKIFEPQREQNGNFPNVPDQLPNPERPVVFDPAIATAGDADVILASDPDADRLGLAVKDKSGKFQHLTGNRIAILLADYILRKRKAAGTLTPQHYVVETLVTTPLVAQLAKSSGIRAFDDLLVGFKYIAQVMDREGPDKFVFGAEESLGYLCGQYARDKDAAVAALYTLENAAELKAQGKTLLDRLDEIFAEQGYFLEGQISKTCEGAQGKQQIDQLMQAFRAKPPTELAGIALGRVRDYGKHEIRSLPKNEKAQDLPQPSGDLLFFDSVPGPIEISIAVRPSGTEPKIKFYCFARAACSQPDKLPEVRTATDAAMKAAQQALSAWLDATLKA
ncbi:MAG: phospho-sugar mutase [Planctomycetales bacterium]